MGGNSKFQVQDSLLEYFWGEIGRFEKRIALSEKKPPLVIIFHTIFAQKVSKLLLVGTQM